MLTGMKLTGDIEGITAYHCRQENYYFKQGKDLVDELSDKGIIARSDQVLGYVVVRGRLAGRLGFNEGESISEIDFNNLLEGKDRQGKVVSRKHKCHGIDLTFSPPKSASVAALVLGEKAIVELHRLAVTETMQEIERLSCANLGKGRTGHTGRMVWVEVLDGYSREKDPHLHTHCVVMNLTEFNNGRFYALDGKKILRRDFNQLFGAIYREKLAERLHHDHGYEIDYTKGGEWRLRKIPQGLDEIFSTRRRQILEAEAKGLSDIEAWRRTRKDKDNSIDGAKVRAWWQEKLSLFKEKHKGDMQRKEKKGDAGRREWAEKAVFSIEAEQERRGIRGVKASKAAKWQIALRRATNQESLVTKENLIYEYLCEEMRDETWRSGPWRYERALIELKEEVRRGNIVEIDGYYTSWEMVRAEREYLEVAKNRTSSIYFDDAQEKVREWKKNNDTGARARKLSSIQSKAVEKILGSKEQVVVVQGDAGSGKTTALKMAADILKAKGVTVIGLAMTGIAADNLQKETGVASTTIKTFLEHPGGFKGANRVILLDEASMLDSRQAARLFNIARKNNDKIILVGDRNQLEAIAAGRVFERLVELKEKEGKLIELNENYRQRDIGLRMAVDMARKAQMRQSLEILEARGDIIEIENKFVKGESSGRKRREMIAKEYKNDDTLVICSTQAARDELNILIRNKLKLDGYLKKEAKYTLARQTFEGIDEEYELKLSEGEKIVFTKNEYKNYDLRNGERATIEKLHPIRRNIITVKTEDGRKLDIDTKIYKHIGYGYALTTYKAQGQTYNKVVVDADTSIPTLNDMRNQYVNITRARDSVKIYTDDKETLKDLAEILEHKRDTLDRLDITLDTAKEREQAVTVKTQFEMELEHARSIINEPGRARGISRGFGRELEL